MFLSLMIFMNGNCSPFSWHFLIKEILACIFISLHLDVKDEAVTALETHKIIS